MDCPVFWVSKLQSEIALSTTEAEYIALSHSMRETLPLIELLKEVYAAMGTSNQSKQGDVKCTVFEDNNGCIELAKCPKMRPRTKHISIKYHHFRSKVLDGTIKIMPIDTLEQQADIFTKALARDQFRCLRKFLIGW